MGAKARQSGFCGLCSTGGKKCCATFWPSLDLELVQFLGSALPRSHCIRPSACSSLEARWEAHLQSDSPCRVAWGFLGNGKGLGVEVLLVLYYLLFFLRGWGLFRVS